MKRRKFLKEVGLATGALAATTMLPGIEGQAEAANKSAPNVSNVSNQPPASGKPNILVIIVDQLRFPQGLFNQEQMDLAAPRLAELRSQSVSFDYHYAAAAMCSPSRSTMLTGLYTHQNGMFLTNTQGLVGTATPPSLDPGFPTWGSILRRGQFGYNTYWWGKWHLSGNDSTTPEYAEQYGFTMGGLPCPAPNGGPGQGLGLDPVNTQVFKDWLGSFSTCEPWCTTVSLVNPHDIAWFPGFTKGRPPMGSNPGSPPQPGEDNPPSIFHDLPANFERWPEALLNEGKPTLQQAQVLLIDAIIGVMPTNPGSPIPGYPELWYELLDLYFQVTSYVDRQIGAVLDALEAVTLDDGSTLADNTVVIFTSDHGEYGGAHGLRNKGFAVYEEGIRVPLYVMDPTGTIIPPDQRGTTRNELTSHVDLVPLLMTLASRSNEWRSKPQFAHLAGRADLAAMLSDPTAKGRDYILSTSDEDLPEETPKTGTPIDQLLAILAALGQPPSHVIGYRTKTEKLGVYSKFAPGTIDIMLAGQQWEMYNYQADGVAEVINHAPGGSAPEPVLFENLYGALFHPTSGAVYTELRQPLPAYLTNVQAQAINTYLAYQACLADPTQCPDPPAVNC